MNKIFFRDGKLESELLEVCFYAIGVNLRNEYSFLAALDINILISGEMIIYS